MATFFLMLIVGTLLLVAGAIGSAFCAGSLFYSAAMPLTRKQSFVGLCACTIIATFGGVLSTYAWGRQASEETRALVTGGKTFVWLRMNPRNRDPDKLLVQLVHAGGDEIAYDIEIDFVEGMCDGFEDWTVFKAINAGTGSPRRHFVPVLSRNVLRSLQMSLEPSCDDAYYLAIIQTRNRAVIQQTLMKKRQGRWLFSARVVDIATDDELVQRIHADVADQVQWPDVSQLLDALRSAQTILDDLSP